MSSSDFSEFISDFSSGMEVRKSAAETVGCIPEQYIASMIYRDGNDSKTDIMLTICDSQDRKRNTRVSNIRAFVGCTGLQKISLDANRRIRIAGNASVGCDFQQLTIEHRKQEVKINRIYERHTIRNHCGGKLVSGYHQYVDRILL